MPKWSNERRLERPAFRKRELELEKECNRVGAYYEKVKANEQPNETKLRRDRITKRIHAKESLSPYVCETNVGDRDLYIALPHQQLPRPRKHRLNLSQELITATSYGNSLRHKIIITHNNISSSIYLPDSNDNLIMVNSSKIKSSKIN